MQLPLPTISLFLALLTAHVVGDFVLQTAGDANRKHRIPVLVRHAAIVAALSYLLAGNWRMWEIPLLVLVSHAVIDRIKAAVGGRSARGFLLDQLAHVAAIAGIVLLVTALRAPQAGYGVALLGKTYLRVLVFFSGAVLTIRAGGFLIGLAVQPLLSQVENLESREGATLTGGLKGGGQLIGQLERALVFLFILMNQPAAVGFLITAKSIFRFGEIKDSHQRMLAEYIIVGTLMSFGYGIFLSYLTRLALDALA